MSPDQNRAGPCWYRRGRPIARRIVAFRAIIRATITTSVQAGGAVGARSTLRQAAWRPVISAAAASRTKSGGTTPFRIMKRPDPNPAGARRASRAPERSEECADLLGQEVRGLQSGEVTAARHPRPPAQVERALRPGARRMEDLSGKLRVSRRHVDPSLGKRPS